MNKGTQNPVVVYGASGYTGRLVCEYLRQYQIPFVAAGRNVERLEQIMAKVPGIETAEYEIAQVEHSVEALSELFKGSKVVCNTVGPFEYLGAVTVEASLNAGCHYLDTTGEQGFMKDIAEKYGDQYAAQQLVLAPGTAYMYTPLDVCAHYALEEEGIDTLECVASTNGVPTFASTQSIFALLKSEMFYLVDNQLEPWPESMRGMGFETIVPGHAFTQLGHPWGGGSLPLYFKNDALVRNCKQLVSFTNRAMFSNLMALSKHYEENIRGLPRQDQEKELSEIAASLQPAEPPRENMLVHRSKDHVVGSGTANEIKVVLHSGPPYLQTGVYQAAVANKLLEDGPNRIGFASACQVAGHRYLLGQLKNFLPTQLAVC